MILEYKNKISLIWNILFNQKEVSEKVENRIAEEVDKQVNEEIKVINKNVSDKFKLMQIDQDNFPKSGIASYNSKEGLFRVPVINSFVANDLFLPSYQSKEEVRYIKTLNVNYADCEAPVGYFKNLAAKELARVLIENKTMFSRIENGFIYFYVNYFTKK